MKRKIAFGIKTAALLTAASVFLCGCSAESLGKIINENNDRDEKTDKPQQSSPAAAAADETTSGSNTSGALIDTLKGTLLSYDGGDGINIERLDKDDGSYSGDKGVWTVFVYMCGSDLESDQASATDDMIEMQDATESCSNLRFVIEADGTKEWQNNFCENNKKQRVLIQNGGYEILESGSSTNMGKSDTLADFLEWGLKNYPSEYMVLDFWDHGGGSITGVCFDENFDMDSLGLDEIDRALASVYDLMPQKFDLIGFDACLMATIETANILVPYGKYMIASQNLESGNGWDYNSFATGANAMVQSGAEMGTYLADGYYNACIRSFEEDDATQSVIDLSKIDSFIKAFNLYAKDAYGYAADHLSEVIKAAKESLNFGGNNRTEGYTNMVDISNLLSYSGSFADDTSRNALIALEDCVVYAKNGKNEKTAGGLSLYYPLSVQGSSEINIFKSLCISPYYLSLVDLCAYGSSTNGDTSFFDFDGLLNSFSQLWAGGSLSGDYDYWDQEEDNNLNFDQSYSALEYEIEPHIDDDGYYTFKLTEDSLYDLDTVYCNVMESYWDDSYGKEYMLDLGSDDYVEFDWNTGYCWDAFDGLWICLPDGQALCAYLIDWTSDDGVYSNIYTCPIYLNDEYTNLKIVQTYYDDATVTEAIGTWAGVDEYGAAARDVYQLQDGDVIEPCYPAYDAETFEYECDYYGEPYVYSSYDSFGYDYLEDADYYYSFEIHDYFDNTLFTDFVLFGIEDGDLYYYY
ncbi:MAG: clostripain-related cysteine peptidase [Firmicutes bacterium]|nr:clostripain-related cysteine peptidase [[Eubacterium] siraeum]MCM1487170.1 clostripain-related cysteine peptidase [Bacillota bacterium]